MGDTNGDSQRDSGIEVNENDDSGMDGKSSGGGAGGKF